MNSGRAAGMLKYMGAFSPQLRPSPPPLIFLKRTWEIRQLQPYKNGAAYSRKRYCIPLPARP